MNVYVYGQTPKTTNRDPQLLYFPEGDERSHKEAEDIWQKMRLVLDFAEGGACCTLPIQKNKKNEETWMHIQFYSSGFDGDRLASFFVLLLLSKQEMEDCKWSPWSLKDSTGFFVARDRWIRLDAPKTYAQPFAVENTENTENTGEEFSKRVRISKDLIHGKAKKIFFWENEQDISKEAFSALCIQNPSQAASYSLLQCKMNNNFPSASFAAPFGMLCGGTKPNEIQKDGVLFEWAAIKTDTTAHQTNPRLTALPSKPSTTTSHHTTHKETTLQQNSSSPNNNTTTPIPPPRNNTTTQQSALNLKEQRTEPSKSQPNSSRVPLRTETKEDATPNQSIKELFSRQSTYLWLSTFCLLSFNVYLFTQQTSLKSKISQQKNSQIKAMLSNQLFKERLSESISGALKTEKVYASRTIADAFQTTVQNIKANADEIKKNTNNINKNDGKIIENTKHISANKKNITNNSIKIIKNSEDIGLNNRVVERLKQKVERLKQKVKALTDLVGQKTDTAQEDGSLYARNAFCKNEFGKHNNRLNMLETVVGKDTSTETCKNNPEALRCVIKKTHQDTKENTHAIWGTNKKKRKTKSLVTQLATLHSKFDGLEQKARKHDGKIQKLVDTVLVLIEGLKEQKKEAVKEVENVETIIKILTRKRETLKKKALQKKQNIERFEKIEFSLKKIQRK